MARRRLLRPAADVARLIKAKVGLRVAAVDIGGWDMHTNIGGPDGGDMRNRLNELAGALGAFATDLGPALDNTSIVTMSEFGRRVEANGNSGVDHGHGGLMLLLGGGMNGGKVHGSWPGLSAGSLDQGDLAGANDYRDVMTELLGSRMGVKDCEEDLPWLRGEEDRRLPLSQLRTLGQLWRNASTSLWNLSFSVSKRPCGAPG